MAPITTVPSTMRAWSSSAEASSAGLDPPKTPDDTIVSIKTIIVTGASQGIGAAVANLFLERGYNVVGNSRHINEKNELRRSDSLALVDGDIALPATAERCHRA